MHTSTYVIPPGIDDEAVLMLADILPTSYEVGAVNGRIRPGDTVAIVGAGPIGLSAILGSKLYSPGHVVAIDLVESRLEAAKQFGADVTVNPATQDPLEAVTGLTDGLGADVAIEAVGVPETFELCTRLYVRAGTWRTSACTGRGRDQAWLHTATAVVPAHLDDR